MRDKPPAPGSDEAFEIGCTCPRMDNSYGRGYMGGIKDEHGSILYVISGNCPIHTTKVKHEKE